MRVKYACVYLRLNAVKISVTFKILSYEGSVSYIHFTSMSYLKRLIYGKFIYFLENRFRDFLPMKCKS